MGAWIGLAGRLKSIATSVVAGILPPGGFLSCYSAINTHTGDNLLSKIRVLGKKPKNGKEPAETRRRQRGCGPQSRGDPTTLLCGSTLKYSRAKRARTNIE